MAHWDGAENPPAGRRNEEDGMGKLRLLLSVGAMLSLAAGGANAARIMGQPGNDASPTGTGIVTDATGFQESGSPYSGGQGQGETESQVPFAAAPAPGTINFRINSFVNEFPMYTSFSGMNSNGTPASNAGNKIQGYGIYGWIRFEMGLDGMTKGGIRYGSYFQIRENNTTALTANPTYTSGAGLTSNFAQSASADSSDNTLYVRHANVYIGTDQIGLVRVGTGLGAMTLFETGLFDDFDIGGWISFASSNIPSNMVPVWPWADEGGEYMAARIGYVSPVIFGFDGGIFFAPNNSGPFDGSGCTSAFGGVGCATQSSSNNAADLGRYRNELGIALRYRNAFGPVGLAVSGIYTTSGVVNPGPNVTGSGGAAGAGTPATAASAGAARNFNGLSIGDIGAEVSFNHQLAVGANIMWGAFNGNWGLQPKATATIPATTAIAWEAGVKYTIPQAPITLGTYYFNYKNAGTAGLPTQRVYQGLDVGAVYGLGPGAVLVAEYAWGQNYQGGVNFLGGPNPALDNKVQAQVFTVGMSVRF